MSETLEPALPDQLDAQAERLMRRLCDQELTIATAESCTGGMLAALLTDIEGCGRGFRPERRVDSAPSRAFRPGRPWPGADQIAKGDARIA